MSIPKSPDPAKLIISVFMKEKKLFISLFDRLEALAGPADMISRWLDFNFTNYYYREMGFPLFRRLVAFRNLINQDKLSEIKLSTNLLEKEYDNKRGRRFNIDPGYLLSSRFILATGKDYSHRIYIGNGIYGDLTLMMTQKGFKFLEWTYPDYKSQDILTFLEKVRQKYLLDLKNLQRKNL